MSLVSLLSQTACNSDLKCNNQNFNHVPINLLKFVLWTQFTLCTKLILETEECFLVGFVGTSKQNGFTFLHGYSSSFIASSNFILVSCS